ncbi:MAG: hypothetical protein R2795_00345 [Saprospiraceae bacterium]
MRIFVPSSSTKSPADYTELFMADILAGVAGLPTLIKKEDRHAGFYQLKIK